MTKIGAKVRHIHKNGPHEDPTAFKIYFGPTNKEKGKFLKEFPVSGLLVHMDAVEYAEELAHTYAEGYNRCRQQIEELLGEIFPSIHEGGQS